MRVQSLLWLLLVLPGLVSADELGIWVSVGESGPPRTITPALTTISGKPTIVSGAAPFDLTATVRTRTEYGHILVSTGWLPVATAISGSKGGAGAFPACVNKAGHGAPFCLPEHGSSLYPGTTYYITWDPSFFNGTNTSVVVQGSYVDASVEGVSQQAFASFPLAAGRGFHAWAVDSASLRGTAGANVSISIAALAHGAPVLAHAVGPTVFVTKRPAYHQPPAPIPAGPELYIGLPLIGSFVAVMLVGTCLWNRKARRIGLGNIMSRGGGRGGYSLLNGGTTDRGPRRKRERGHADGEGSHRLMDLYHERDGASGARGRTRRDSVDSLESFVSWGSDQHHD